MRQAQALDKSSHCAGRCSGVERSTSSTMALPITAASANSPTWATCSALVMPNPTATGSLRPSANAGDQRGGIGGDTLLRAGNADARDGVHKTLGVRGDCLEALVGAGGRCKKDRRETHAIHFGEVLGGLFDNHVGGEHAVNAGGLGIVSEFAQAIAEDGIEIAEDDEAGIGTRGANFAAQWRERL